MFFTPNTVINPKGSLQYLTRTSDLSFAGTSTNFSASQLTLGPPHPDRRIFLGLAWRIDSGFAARTLTDVTIDPSGVAGAVTCTIHGQVGYYEGGGVGGYGVALASAIVADGATGVVEATVSGLGVIECVVVIYRRLGLNNSTPFDIATDENEGFTGSLSSTIDTAAGGMLLGICAQTNIGGTPAWTAGLSQDELFQTATNRLEILIGSTGRTSAATGATVSSSATSNSSEVGNGFVVVSWV